MRMYSTYAHTLCLLSFSVCIYIICGNVCTFWCFHTTGNLAASASVDTTIKVRLLVYLKFQTLSIVPKHLAI